MKKLAIIVPIVLIGIGIWGALAQNMRNAQGDNAQNAGPLTSSQETERVVAKNLDTPWGMAFLPDGSLLFTERQGTVRRIQANGEMTREPLATIASVKEAGEGGLLGIAVHPQYPEKPYIYMYYTYENDGNNTKNRLARFTYANNEISKEETLIDNIPGANFHNGGIVRFGPDGNLYVGTGDAGEPSRAQDTKVLAGKILRLTDGGQPVSGNPFRNEVYSYGHRNVQGIAWDDNGTLFATEHGRSGVLSGLDELNKIEIGKNYGWPVIQGNETRSGMVTALRNSGNTTWAPAGLAYLNGMFYFGGLRGQSLYRSELRDGVPQPVTPLFEKKYGRIRAVIASPDGSLYFSTSNQDGRGNPATDDDKIIRVIPTTGGQ